MTRSKFERLQFTVALLALTIFVGFWLVVATFPEFFFFNPFNNPDNIRTVELTFSTIGWVLLSTVSPALLLAYTFGRKDAIRILPVTVLWWPISLVISHATLFIQTGDLYLGYLQKFPIFIFTDVLLPILFFITWVDLKEHNSRID